VILCVVDYGHLVAIVATDILFVLELSFFSLALLTCYFIFHLLKFKLFLYKLDRLRLNFDGWQGRLDMLGGFGSEDNTLIINLFDLGLALYFLAVDFILR